MENITKIEFRIFYLQHLPKWKDYERKESSSAWWGIKQGVFSQFKSSGCEQVSESSCMRRYWKKDAWRWDGCPFGVWEKNSGRGTTPATPGMAVIRRNLDRTWRVWLNSIPSVTPQRAVWTDSSPCQRKPTFYRVACLLSPLYAKGMSVSI